MKTDSSNTKDIIIGLILFILVVIFWYFSWQYIDYKIVSTDLSKLSDVETRGLFGDKFGVINALFSALAFAGIIFTILLQKRELKLQREELEETRGEFIKQNDTLKKQRFENTFFQLLSLHNEIVDKLKIKPIDGETYEKREFFIGAIKDLKYRSHCKYFKYSALTKLDANEVSDFKAKRDIQHSFFEKLEKEEIKNLQTLSDQDIENFISEPIDDKEKIVKSEYERFFHLYQYNLGHYFRNLYHIFKYVHKTSLITDKEKQFYCNIVRAQLSTDELVLIFYNSLTPINYYSDKPNLGYPNFKYLIDNYDILQNMNSRLLLDKRHKDIFDKNVVVTEPLTFKKDNDEI
ncbi:MAG: putative phage abortive infection protein [Candidatus Delongbacteria bacterium]|nr:putative phage abortive infection protein [Candidatus Delongbacteria bacterium]MBN2836402.1 putative phage abortive infection protein [Candidatus Delongbacteria bacterium]